MKRLLVYCTMWPSELNAVLSRMRSDFPAVSVNKENTGSNSGVWNYLFAEITEEELTMAQLKFGLTNDGSLLEGQYSVGLSINPLSWIAEQRQ